MIGVAIEVLRWLSWAWLITFIIVVVWVILVEWNHR